MPFSQRDESVLNNDYFRNRKEIELSTAALRAKAQGRSYTPGTISDVSTTPTPLDSLFGTRANTPRQSESNASSQTDLSEHNNKLPRGVTVPSEDREKIDVSKHSFLVMFGFEQELTTPHADRHQPVGKTQG